MMTPRRIQIVDISGESPQESCETSDRKLEELMNLTHDALLIVAQNFDNTNLRDDLLAEINSRVANLILAHSASGTDLLTENENDSVNNLMSRSQPGLNEILLYGSSLYVSIRSRLNTNYYQLFLKNLDLYKRNFLTEYCSLLDKYIESQDFFALMDLQALSKSFMDQGIFIMDKELTETASYTGKIYAFCTFHMLDTIETGGVELSGLKKVLLRLQVMRDQYRSKISLDN